jgi:hypothetical protein
MAPPKPVIDKEEPEVSTKMDRDLGNKGTTTSVSNKWNTDN